MFTYAAMTVAPWPGVLQLHGTSGTPRLCPKPGCSDRAVSPWGPHGIFLPCEKATRPRGLHFHHKRRRSSPPRRRAASKRSRPVLSWKKLPQTPRLGVSFEKNSLQYAVPASLRKKNVPNTRHWMLFGNKLPPIRAIGRSLEKNCLQYEPLASLRKKIASNSGHWTLSGKKMPPIRAIGRFFFSVLGRRPRFSSLLTVYTPI
jgi:hypothetical protein